MMDRPSSNRVVVSKPSSNVMKWLIYALFAVMPMTQATVGGHVAVIEVVLLAVIFALFITGNRGDSDQRTLFLDVVVIIYVFINLMAVTAGSDDWYASMRYFRWNVLAPVIIYFVLRKARLSADLLKYGLLFLVPGILVQAAMFMNFFITFGVRPVGVEGIMRSTITLSAFFAIGAWVLFFLRKNISTRLGYLLAMSTSLVLTVALAISFTRMAIVSFVLFTPIVHWVWTNRKIRRQASIVVMSFLGIFVAIILASSVAFKNVQIEDEKAVQKSIERVYNVDLYIKDLTGRLAFWGTMADIALEHPIFGTGGAGHTIGHRGGTVFSLGSVHNVLISSIIVAGVPGLIIFLLLIWGTYRCFNSIENNTELVTSLGKILWCSYTMLILVAITNDVTGARILILFFLMGLIANLSLVNPASISKKSEQAKESPARVLSAKSRKGLLL